MTTGAIGLNTHIWNNNIRSFMMLALYPAIIMATIWFIAFAAGLFFFQSSQTELHTGHGVYMANSLIASYWPHIFGAVGIWFGIAFFAQTRMIRRMAGSRPVARDEEPTLYNLLENLCISRGMTMPHVEIIETNALNAFASGVHKNSYGITVTRGLLDSLQEDELEAVLGHELTHILNHDVRLLIISVIFVGMIGTMAQSTWRSLLRGPAVRGARGKNSGQTIVFMLILALILSLGYVATTLTRFALSRKREFMADAGAIQLTKNPDAMMRALMRIQGQDNIDDVPADIKLMCIENARPFLGLMATHPPIEKRIDAIAQTTQSAKPELSDLKTKDTGKSKDQKNPWKS